MHICLWAELSGFFFYSCCSICSTVKLLTLMFPLLFWEITGRLDDSEIASVLATPLHPRFIHPFCKQTSNSERRKYTAYCVELGYKVQVLGLVLSRCIPHLTSVGDSQLLSSNKTNQIKLRCGLCNNRVLRTHLVTVLHLHFVIGHI